jgi:hypothetical protein
MYALFNKTNQKRNINSQEFPGFSPLSVPAVAVQPDHLLVSLHHRLLALFMYLVLKIKSLEVNNFSDCLLFPLLVCGKIVNPGNDRINWPWWRFVKKHPSSGLFI